MGNLAYNIRVILILFFSVPFVNNFLLRQHTEQLYDTGEQNHFTLLMQIGKIWKGLSINIRYSEWLADAPNFLSECLICWSQLYWCPNINGVIVHEESSGFNIIILYHFIDEVMCNLTNTTLNV